MSSQPSARKSKFEATSLSRSQGLNEVMDSLAMCADLVPVDAANVNGWNPGLAFSRCGRYAQ